jgi:hypothetical protein
VLQCRQVRDAPFAAKPLLVAPLIAIPGVAEVGTAALGTSTGVFLMLAAMLVWTARTVPPISRVAFGGLLYGMAAASRYDLVLFGPALLLVSCVQIRPTGQVQVRLNFAAVVAVSIGLAVFFTNQWAMTAPINAALGYDIDGSTGVGNAAFNYPKLLNYWAALQTFAPLALLAMVTAGAFWPDAEPVGSEDSPSVPRLESLLAVTGLTITLGWLLRAPIPHLRYVYPALICFAFLGVIYFKNTIQAVTTQGSNRHWFLCQIMALVCVISSSGTTLRSIVMADSDMASWEWSREVPFDYYRRFVAQPQQTEIADYIKNALPADAIIYSHVPYALRYLTNRPIAALERAAVQNKPSDKVKSYLVLTPASGTYLYMNPTLSAWLQSSAVLQKEIGRYSVYQLPPDIENNIKIFNLSRTNYEGHPNSQRWIGR